MKNYLMLLSLCLVFVSSAFAGDPESDKTNEEWGKIWTPGKKNEWKAELHEKKIKQYDEDEKEVTYKGSILWGRQRHPCYITHISKNNFYFGHYADKKGWGASNNMLTEQQAEEVYKEMRNLDAEKDDCTLEKYKTSLGYRFLPAKTVEAKSSKKGEKSLEKLD